MSNGTFPTGPNLWASRGKVALGFFLAVGLLAGLAEIYLRVFPPRDLFPFLGEASPLTGIYAPDNDFVAANRSWETFCQDNAERLAAYLPLSDAGRGRPVWAFFGNSFVQAPRGFVYGVGVGMLLLALLLSPGGEAPPFIYFNF